MKKITKVMFLLVCLFALASCGGDKKPDEEPNEQQQQQPEQPMPPVHEHIACPTCGKCIAESCDGAVEDKCAGHIVEKVTVEFKDAEGNVLATEVIDKGASITKFPECTEEGYYYYWDKTLEELTAVLENTVVTATKLDYYVNAKYYVDGELFFEKKALYFDKYLMPELPNDYENCVWNETSRTLVEDTYYIEYTLSYTLKSVYTITYKDGINELALNPTTYEIGNVLELPTYEKEGYYFVGWFLSTISLHKVEEITEDMKGDLTLYARFTEIVKQKKLELPDAPYHFERIKKTPHSSGNGTFVYQPEFPAGVASGATNYEWSTSNKYVATVSQFSSITAKKAGYCVLTAKSLLDSSVTINCVIHVGVDGVRVASLEEANNIVSYTVTFVGKDGEKIAEQVVQKGGYAIAPKPLEYEGLAFNGWDKDIYNINENTTITATYKKGTNNYAGKTFSLIGDSISTYQDFVPKDYKTFYPYPTADVNDVNQTWWMQAINKIGGSLFINNSYSGSCVAAGGSSSSNNINRLKELIASNQHADVIVIFMGSNDCNDRSGVTASEFEKQYREMLDKLNDLCNGAELILCTLPKSNLYSQNRQTEFNGIINNIAKDYSLKIINLDKVDLVPHLIDSAHPGTSGMTEIANQIVKDLLK